MARRTSAGSFILFLLVVAVLFGVFSWYNNHHETVPPRTPPPSNNPATPPGTGTRADLLPDARLTPGDVADVTKEDVCTPGYSKKVRNVPESVKRRVYKMYDREKEKGVCCEVDHLISLELGGSNDIKNLWPEPYEPRPGAYEKDKVENYLHRQVCSGEMTLADAQKQIATDWYTVYQRIQ